MGIRFFAGQRKTLFFVLVIAMIVIVAAVFVVDGNPQKTTYSNISNKELKTRTSRLVKDIRALADGYRKRDSELLSVLNRTSRREMRVDERTAMREQWIRESDAVHNSFVREYKEKYWADAILLRNELHRRLPKQTRKSDVAVFYQHPTNILGIEAVADNLDLLSKSLAD